MVIRDRAGGGRSTVASAGYTYAVITAAILGAGPIGSAIAHRLAERGRVGRVRLVDEAESVAAGKALDIRQAGPIAHSDVVVEGSSDVLSSVGADVVVIADPASGEGWEGERGLALVDRLQRSGNEAPLVFAAPGHTWLMEAAARELGLARDRLIGTAASAARGALAALVHLDTGETGAAVAVTGRPPVFVPAWSAATIGGSLVSDRIAPHRLLAMTAALRRQWPFGPQAIAAPTSLVVEALASGSRALLPALAIADEEFGARGRAALLALELGQGRILRRVVPSLSSQERNEATTAVLSARP